ncbi:hypothetical protein ACRYCC_27220 [Actinomadura scrupuli]|uniref:hypothetical protein n=1 Tax=Actinomadura scrupuli TaxID=559629 RepID=UPI003D998185
MSRYSLKPHQVDLLKRIVDGTDPVTSKEPRLANSVYALRGRGYVTTPRKDGVWTAVITDVGHYYLEHGRHPKDRVPRQPSPKERPSRKEKPAKLVITVEELVVQVEMAGGTLKLTDPDKPTRRALRKAVSVALTNPEKLPEGHRLDAYIPYTGDVWVSLRDSAAVEGVPTTGPERPVELPLVPVPTRLTNPHPLVAATRDRFSRAIRRHDKRDSRMDNRNQTGVVHMKVSKEALPRALRLAQALFTEAERRGYRVAQGSDSRHRYSGGACIVIQGHAYELSFWEETDSVPHRATAAELKKAERGAWYQVPRSDSVASGRLQIRHGDPCDTRYLFADRRRWKLEDELADVLAQFEQKAEEAEQHRLERARKGEEQRQRWEGAMRGAKEQFGHAHLVKVLSGQIKRMGLADDIRRYVARIRDHASETRTQLSEESERWLTWAETYATAVDPTRTLPRFPEVPEPKADDLRPYLGGWSPHGPPAYW